MKKMLSVSAALLLGLGAGSYFVGTHSQGQQPQQAAPLAVNEPVSFRDIVRRVLPAVVSIEAKGKPTPAKIGPKNPVKPFVPDGVPEEFKKYFEDFKQIPDLGEPRLGFGSGFFIDPSGVLLTNFHVIDGADYAVVTLTDGRKFNSKSIHGDRRTDLAVVKLDLKGATVPFLEMADSDMMEIGDRVLAVGAPFGLTGSVTQGIVSAKGRHNLNMNMYEDFIQTDAAINPGNSGGPLVNLEGKVVGINAAIKSRSGGFQGVGLAIASNLAKHVSRSLSTDGVVKRGYLGVQIRELDPDVAVRLGVDKNAGVVVSDVFENTPAAKAGMQAGDILTTIDGKSIKDGKALQHTVASLPIGKAAAAVVVRDGKTMTLNVTVEEQPTDFGSASVPAPRATRGSQNTVHLEKFGVEISDMTDELAEEFGYRKGTQGVLVAKVHPGTPASEAGLRRGMLITKVDQQKVTGLTATQQAFEAGSLQRGVLLQVQSPQGGLNFVLLKSAS